MLNLSTIENQNNNKMYYLRITEEQKRKYGASRSYFLELVCKLSKRTGFCSAYDDYFIEHCSISKKTIYNYINYFIDQGLLTRSKDKHGRRFLNPILGQKNTIPSVKVTPLSVKVTSQTPLKPIVDKGLELSYNKVYNKRYKTKSTTNFFNFEEIEIQDVEKDFDLSLKKHGLLISTEHIIKETSLFINYLKQRKTSRYSLIQLIDNWIMGDNKGVFFQAFNHKKVIEKENRLREHEKIRQLEIEKEREESSQIMDTVFKIKDAWEYQHKRKIPLQVYSQIMEEAHQ